MEINNINTIKEVHTGAGTEQSRSGAVQFSNIIAPTIEVNPKIVSSANIVAANESNSIGGITIYTAPADKNAYIRTLQCGFHKSSACDVTTGSASIVITSEGITKTLAIFSILTLTAQNESVFLHFPNPVKIDKNTSVIWAGNSYTAGVCRKYASITGFTA